MLSRLMCSIKVDKSFCFADFGVSEFPTFNVVLFHILLGDLFKILERTFAEFMFVGIIDLLIFFDVLRALVRNL
jgi:hypothetical protein